MTATQLAIDLPTAAPIRSVVQSATLPETCPVRDRCLIPQRVNGEIVMLPRTAEQVCGFEQAGMVRACHKRRGMEGER